MQKIMFWIYDRIIGQSMDRMLNARMEGVRQCLIPKQ